MPFVAKSFLEKDGGSRFVISAEVLESKQVQDRAHPPPTSRAATAHMRHAIHQLGQVMNSPCEVLECNVVQGTAIKAL